MFFAAWRKMNHQSLKEFSLGNKIFRSEIIRSNLWRRVILKYFDRCLNLKILFETEFKPYPTISMMQENITSFKLKNLQEFHLIGFEIDLDVPSFKRVLESLAENMPKVQRLCLTTELKHEQAG